MFFCKKPREGKGKANLKANRGLRRKTRRALQKLCGRLSVFILTAGKYFLPKPAAPPYKTADRQCVWPKAQSKPSAGPKGHTRNPGPLKRSPVFWRQRPSRPQWFPGLRYKKQEKPPVSLPGPFPPRQRVYAHAVQRGRLHQQCRSPLYPPRFILRAGVWRHMQFLCNLRLHKMIFFLQSTDIFVNHFITCFTVSFLLPRLDSGYPKCR